MGYTAFQKKSEFGPGKIIAKNSSYVNVQTKYLIEPGSSLTVNDIEINQKNPNTKELLYGKEYGKGSK